MKQKKKLDKQVPNESTKKQKPNGTFWLILVLAVLASVMVLDRYMLRKLVFEPTQSVTQKVSRTELQTLRIVDAEGQKSIELGVEVRDDDEERALGLSFRESLAEGEGMLFVFEELGRPVFWMKDMKFGLDVLWMNQGVIVQIDEEVPPPTETNPKIETMVPKQEIDMVLEVPAGYAAKQGISVGMKLQMDKPE